MLGTHPDRSEAALHRKGARVDALTRHRLSLLGLDAEAVGKTSIDQRPRLLHLAFVRRIPCETLSERRRWRERPADRDAWPRTTDRFLREAATEGLGGTCFAMAYALADILRGVGVNAHTALGKHLDRDESHAVVIVYPEDGSPRLFDPSYFLLDGVPLYPGGETRDALGDFALVARCGPMLCLQRVRGSGRPRTLYSLIPAPAPPDAYRREWIESVARRRDVPVRIARRAGDAIACYSEAKGMIEMHDRNGVRRVNPGGDLARVLHQHFGVAEDVLRAHFAAVVPG
jgi:hypothetical protein